MSGTPESRKAKTSTAFINTKRRGFLQGAAIAGGAAATGAATAIANADTTVESPVEEANGSKGYELTEHIKKYYQRARF